jgi:hypothetical protein
MNEHSAALMAAALFGIGAVAIILYHHSAATGQIMSALGGPSTGSGTAPAATASSGNSISLAGTPTPGQTGSVATPPIQPLQSGPGWTLQ